MKKIQKISLIILSLCVLLPSLSLAAASPLPKPGSAKIETAEDIGGLINDVATFLYGLLLAVAVIFGLIAAFGYLTSAGDSTKIGKASKQLLFAAVAIVVAIAAWGLSKLIPNILGLK